LARIRSKIHNILGKNIYKMKKEKKINKKKKKPVLFFSLFAKRIYKSEEFVQI
jgi:hypothetical protein